MPTVKSKYKYSGPVYKFDKYVGDWEATTWAVSSAKALANLSYRYKTENNLVPGTRILLDPDYLGDTTAIDDDVLVTYHQMTIDEIF